MNTFFQVTEQSQATQQAQVTQTAQTTNTNNGKRSKRSKNAYQTTQGYFVPTIYQTVGFQILKNPRLSPRSVLIWQTLSSWANSNASGFHVEVGAQFLMKKFDYSDTTLKDSLNRLQEEGYLILYTIIKYGRRHYHLTPIFINTGNDDDDNNDDDNNGNNRRKNKRKQNAVVTEYSASLEKLATAQDHSYQKGMISQENLHGKPMVSRETPHRKPGVFSRTPLGKLRV